MSGLQNTKFLSMSKSNIEWTDLVWNPVTGCNKVSAGCKFCYAKTVHDSRHKAFKAGKLQHLIQYSVPFETVMLHPGRLQYPLKWKKPSKVFVNSMSDLFHEEIPFEFINAVFSVMADCDQHTYQVLTKRPQRVIEFYNWKYNLFGVPWRASDNVWIGVSVEDQATANERIPLLLQVPAAVRFLSCEPLLGEIDLIESLGFFSKVEYRTICDCIQWVIVGGESGPGARPMNPDWARLLRDLCQAAGVPFFFKQWGEWKETDQFTDEDNLFITKQNLQQDGQLYFKVGKKSAGNLLDGKQYLQFPKTETCPA